MRIVTAIPRVNHSIGRDTNPEEVMSVSRKYRVVNPGLVPFPVELPDVKDKAGKAKGIKDDNSRLSMNPVSKKK